MHSDTKINRRMLLRGAIIGACVAPVLLSGGRAAYAKVTKLSVSYRETPNNGNQCDKCGNFIAPSSCKLVEGAINPNGWCGLFKPKA